MTGVVRSVPATGERARRGGVPWGRALTFAALLAGGVVMLVPFLWMLSTSLKPSGDVLILPPRLIPRAPTLGAYRDVAQSFPIWRVLANSLFVAGATTFGQLVVSAMAGYAFARFRFWGRDALFLAFLTTLMVPFAVTMTPLFIIVKTLGWTNSYWGLIVPAMFSAFWGLSDAAVLSVAARRTRRGPRRWTAPAP